ncbi:MAG TPA: alpha/beta hydrolase [Anaeromyxobacteraceae bacterium]|nr:alpha/beta hydrolase [Anaeromyxobacteraceae bacterium]
MQPTSRFVVANGLRHHLLEWDGGGRTTVLCLHGFLDLAWAFHRVGASLAAAGHHVVAVDFRGHGHTDRVGAGGYYHFMDYVLDVADLADAVARDRLAVVGHSMGGSVTAYFAGAFPERVWRAVMMEGIRMPELPPEAVPARVKEWVHGVRRSRRHSGPVYATLADAAARIRRHDPLCPEEEAAFIAEHGTRAVPGGRAFLHDPLHLTRSPYAFRSDHARAFWSGIRCPVLLLDGAQSERVPIDYPQRLASFHDVRREVVPGAGHMMMRHQPERVASLVAGFLAEARGGGATGPARD